MISARDLLRARGSRMKTRDLEFRLDNREAAVPVWGVNSGGGVDEFVALGVGSIQKVHGQTAEPQILVGADLGR
jgi:hypothetical protein